MKKIICGIIIVLISISVILSIYFQFAEKDHIDKAIKEKVYTIITDTQFHTLENDGGSHTNIYYVVDFQTKIISKYEDRYIGFKGYEYKDKLIYEKELSKDKAKELNLLIDEILSKDDINTDNNYNYYIIKDKTKEYKIFNTSNISKLKKILIEIDEK